MIIKTLSPHEIEVLVDKKLKKLQDKLIWEMMALRIKIADNNNMRRRHEKI